MFYFCVMIYWDGRRFCADSVSEARIYAKRKGMNPNWLIDKYDHGYFEVFARLLAKLINLENTDIVQRISKPEFEIKAREMYECKNVFTVPKWNDENIIKYEAKRKVRRPDKMLIA